MLHYPLTQIDEIFKTQRDTVAISTANKGTVIKQLIDKGILVGSVTLK